MKIIVCDVGNVWNHNSKVLEQFADNVLVVALNGKKVTEKYKCIVSPYKRALFTGKEKAGRELKKYGALQKVIQELRKEISLGEDVIFLTDDNPETLFPVNMLKDFSMGMKAHVWLMTPVGDWSNNDWLYWQMLKEIKYIQSNVVVGPNDGYKGYENVPRRGADRKEIEQFYKNVGAGFEELLPIVLQQIPEQMSGKKYTFNHGEKAFKEDVPVSSVPRNITWRTPGVMIPPRENWGGGEPEPPHITTTQGLMITQDEIDFLLDLDNLDSENDEEEKCKKQIEMPVPRGDGKVICGQLRKMRAELAEANGIPFEMEECTHTGFCAGTCPKCDEELAYLNQELEKLPMEQRVYPKYNAEATRIKERMGLKKEQKTEKPIFLRRPEDE